MTIRELEIKYHINHRTIKKYIDKNAFPAYFNNNKWNIDEQSFLDWHILYKKGLFNKVSWDRTYFDTIDTPNKAYWLGFINADGCVHKKSKYISIDIGKRDEEHLVKFAKELHGVPDKMIHNTIHSQTGNPLSHLYLCSNHVVKVFEELGITEVKSGKEQYINTNFDKDFIRGMIDGDGCIRSDLSGIELVGSYQLLETVQNKFLKYLNIKPNKIMEHGSIYKISYRSKVSIYKIVEWLYKDCSVSLLRKQELVNKILNEKIC